MIRTVTTLFDDADEADAAFDTLSRKLAILKGAIVTCGKGEKPDFGTVYLSRHQREACEAELRDGGSLLIVQVEGDAAAEQAVDLLDRHGRDDAADAVALAEPVTPTPPPAPPAAPKLARGGDVRSGPISTLTRKAAPAQAPPDSVSEPEVDATAASEVLPDRQPGVEEEHPPIEEELRTGDRALVRGGARVDAFVDGVPAAETVDLLAERTSVEHRPVNRRLSEEEIAASGLLQDRVVEIVEMREEAAVTTQAFVREELVVRKIVEKRTEQIHDDARRTSAGHERVDPDLAEAVGESNARG